ncbi:hypothetical protein DFJ74DRAFT_767103 [Hyaloraphidium curvatum]|nr:hypothetical protein DFJ74DRAFT_767103 [Hyaloraphidium curvatum]
MEPEEREQMELHPPHKPGNAPAEFLAFTPREFLALFPVAPVPPPDALCRDPPADPAGKLRASEPLDRESLLSALRPSPLLAASARAQVALAPWVVPFHAWRAAAFFGTGSALVSVQWALRDSLGRFSPAELAVGTFVTLLHAAATGLVMVSAPARFTRRFAMPKELSNHPLAVFARWAQLAAAEPGSPLLRHEPDDPLCPCPAKACAGKLLARAGALRGLEVAGHIASGFQFYFFIYLTMPALAYASVTWATPWAAALTALYILLMVEYHCLSLLGAGRTNVGALMLSLRLHRRAAALALRALLARQRAAAVNPPEFTGAADSAPPDEPYLVLLDSLGPTWRARVQALGAASGPLILFALPVYAVIVAVTGIAFGNCLPFGALAAAIHTAFLVTLDLAAFSASNAHVSVVIALVDECRAALQRTSPPSGPASDQLERHDRLLAAFSRARDASLAKFMGFRVDAAVARNVAATALTLAVGLWSILRGGGVRVTLYTTCG